MEGHADIIETIAGAQSALASAPLDRTLHRQHVAAASQLRQAVGSDGDVSLDQAWETYEEGLTLDENEWRTRLVASLDSLRPTAMPEELRQTIELHHRSTRDFLSIPLHLLFSSLLLSYHRSYLSLPIWRPDDAEDEEAPSAQDASQQPRVGANGAYEPTSLPPLQRTEGDAKVWDAILGEGYVREKLREAYARAAWHLTESQRVWELYRAFEMAHLVRDPTPERIETVRQVYLARLKVPHKQQESTFQAFSQFVSTHLPADQYEATMTASNKQHAAAKEVWALRERREDELASPQSTLRTWKSYLRWQASRKPLDADLTSALYERAITYCGTPLPEQAEEWAAAESLWEDYIAFLHQAKADVTLFLDVCNRAVRTLPSSGRLWAAQLRSMARLLRPKPTMEEAFNRALLSRAVHRSTTQLVELLLARVDVERVLAAAAIQGEQALGKSGEGGADPAQDMDRFMEVYAVLSFALGVLAEQEEKDSNLRMEKFSCDWIERAGAGGTEMAEQIWDTAVKAQPGNHQAWLEQARFYVRRADYKKARSIYRAAAGRSLDNKTPLLDAWLEFEHSHGTLAEVDAAVLRVRHETEKAWEAWYQQYMEQQAAEQARAVPVADADMTDGTLPQVHAQAEGADPSSRTSQKRKADQNGGDEDSADTSRNAAAVETTADEGAAAKKSKVADVKKLTRDRENASVIVAGLPSDATEQDVRTLFRDCGDIAEVFGPKVLGEAGAAVSVEFASRESVPGARTKDKKRLREAEVSVNVGWESTLYVTNFPESADDAFIRKLFGQYGTIFDVRWPSKKFLQSRRFCYVQFILPEQAQAALAEHGTQLEAGHKMQVLISDPQRKKQRSDAHANDKELYVAGIARATKVEELRELFAAHGKLLDVRMPTTPDGKAKGIAFVDFENQLDAQKAMQTLNSQKFKGKVLSVTIAGARGGGRRDTPDAGLSRKADARARSIRVAGIPADSQEALIQQFFEKLTAKGAVKSIEWTPGQQPPADAVVEFSDVAMAGRMSLQSDVAYDETHTLKISLLDRGSASALPPSTSTASSSAAEGAAFVPRTATSRARGRGSGRGGLGFVRPRAGVGAGASGSAAEGSRDGETQKMDVDANAGAGANGDSAQEKPPPKGQDRFREMLKSG